MAPQTYPECGALLRTEITCQDHFHQMLFWEAEEPACGVVYHLMVLCYHLQHPSLYSPEGLQHALKLLDEFVSGNKSPLDVRRDHRARVDSGQRAWTITARPGRRGSYPDTIHWVMTAADVVNGGKEN